jgi:hypothetical protein
VTDETASWFGGEALPLFSPLSPVVVVCPELKKPAAGKLKLN